MMRNQKGITLIALVITIIVLLILAGVSIAMLTGENGILTQAGRAKDNTSDAEIADRINMALNGAYATILGEDAIPSGTDVTKDNGLDANYTVTVTEKNMTELKALTTGTTEDVITITNGSKSGKIVYNITAGNFTVEKASYPQKTTTP